MKLLIALAFLTTLSTAGGLQCYNCPPSAHYCSRIRNCDGFNDPRCFISTVKGAGCMEARLCDGNINCCEGELCNPVFNNWHELQSSAHIILPTVLLLGLTASIILYLNKD